MKILVVLIVSGSLHAQWTGPARRRTVTVTTVAQGPRGGPVLLFFPAAGRGVSSYRALLKSLPGYTVVFAGPQHSAAAWPDAGKLAAVEQMAFQRREMREWVRDGLFVLSRLNTSTAGVLGHGAGGMAAAAACQMSASFRACLDLDGESMGSPFVFEESFDQPFLWLRPLRDAPLAPAAAELKDRQMTREEYDAILAGSGAAAMWKSRSTATIVTLHAKDADYESFTSRRAGTRSFDLATMIVREFFDEHLRGRTPLLFGGFATGYAQVVFQQFKTAPIQAPAHP